MSTLTTLPFRFADASDLSDLGSNADRFRWNRRVLERLRAIESEGREPTESEQFTLAHYTAFGNSQLLQRALYLDRTGNYAAKDDLDGLISPDEANTIARGALTQYFTPLPVAMVLGKLADRLLTDIPAPRILEPAAGIGMILGALSAELRDRAEITAVELDLVASRIFRQLHPDARFFGGQGFQDVPLPIDSFDLTISNVPFGAVRVIDPMFGRTEEALTRTLHDFFIAKMLKLTRPGGYCVVLTSYGTLDKKTRTVRSWLARQARLAAAIRLPNGVFQENSGSESGCDILVFQKYHAGEEPELNPVWVESSRTQIDEREINEGSLHATTSQTLDYPSDGSTMISPLFQHGSPDLLGEYVRFSSGHGYNRKDFYVVAPLADDTPLAERIVQRLDAANLQPVANTAPATTIDRPHSGPDTMEVFAVASKHAPRFEAARLVFTAFKALIAQEIRSDDETSVQPLRDAMNAAYDAFTAQYGPFHSRQNQKILGPAIVEYPVLLALEIERDEDGKTVVDRAPIFFQRVATPRRTPTMGTFSLEGALTWCLSERVKVDVSYIAQLAGIGEDEVISGLKGRVVRDLSLRNDYVLVEELCSGNVRKKLVQAHALAKIDPSFREQAGMLEQSLPTPLTRNQINLELGNALVPTAMVSAFISSLVPLFQTYGGSVEYYPVVNQWKVNVPDRVRNSAGAIAWGTSRRSFFQLLDAAIHQRELVVKDEIEEEDGKIRYVTNQAATLEAGVMITRMKEAFVQWLWADEDRASEMERIYNEERNSHVERRYNGDHLQLIGLNTAGLRRGDADPHQKDVIWRILSSPTTYIAHPVGSGKTLMMVGGIAENLRRGIARKALVVVPNHLVGQWAADLLRFYPDLRVLSMTAKDFQKGRRTRFLTMAATGHWDVVVVGMSSFTRLPLPRAIRMRFYAEEISELRNYLAELQERDTRPAKEQKRDRGMKKIEARAEKLEAKLKAIDAGIERDEERLFNLVEMGFDMLIVDEFHLYKNLEFSTTKSGIAGLPNGGSERAFDMWQKIQYFIGKAHKVVVASATPIANTLAEAFVNMKYLQWDLLRSMGLAHFDQWAAQFAIPTQSFELRPDATGFRVVMRMAKFINLPELNQLVRQVMDVRLEEQLNLPRPKIITGKPVPVVIPASDQLQQYLISLGERAEAIKTGMVDPEEDNMLLISSDGRKAALDPRMVGLDRDAGCKLDVLAEHVLKHYDESTPWKGTQLIFCDLGTPRARSA